MDQFVIKPLYGHYMLTYQDHVDIDTISYVTNINQSTIKSEVFKAGGAATKLQIITVGQFHDLDQATNCASKLNAILLMQALQ
jgi:hypothetical protein